MELRASRWLPGILFSAESANYVSGLRTKVARVVSPFRMLDRGRAMLLN